MNVCGWNVDQIQRRELICKQLLRNKNGQEVVKRQFLLEIKRINDDCDDDDEIRRCIFWFG